MLNRTGLIISHWARIRFVAVLCPFAVGLFGCSTATTSTEWAEPNDMASEFARTDDSQNQWSKKVFKLPIELHGSIPGESSEVTAAKIANAIPAEKSSTTSLGNVGVVGRQRVVLYLDESRVPARDDFCSVSKTYRDVPKESNGVVLRAALCDGPRIVSYAKKSLSIDKVSSDKVGTQVASLESALVDSLYQPFNILDADD